jgi:predicted DNA-binding transcriptional regulator AlpA
VASESYFYRNSEVEEVTLTRDPTRRRMEKRGEFPARIHISPRRVAWRRSEIDDWKIDPEGWRRRKQSPGEAAGLTGTPTVAQSALATMTMGERFAATKRVRNG